MRTVARLRTLWILTLFSPGQNVQRKSSLFTNSGMFYLEAADFTTDDLVAHTILGSCTGAAALGSNLNHVEALYDRRREESY